MVRWERLICWSPSAARCTAAFQFKLVKSVKNAWPGVRAGNFQISYSLSKFISQVQDQDFINLATNNDNPLQFTGPKRSIASTRFRSAELSICRSITKVSMIGHFYSPLPQNLRLPELTNGGEIFATDWLGSGLGSGAAPEPLPGTQIGQFMRSDRHRQPANGDQQLQPHFCRSADARRALPGGQPHRLSGADTVPVMTLERHGRAGLGYAADRDRCATNALNFPWLKSMDLRAAWPIKIKDRVTVEPSANIFNVFNFANSFLPGNLPTLRCCRGPNGILAPNVVGGVARELASRRSARVSSPEPTLSVLRGSSSLDCGSASRVGAQKPLLSLRSLLSGRAVAFESADRA